MTEQIDLLTNSCGRKIWFYRDDVFFRQRLAGGPFQGGNVKFLRELCPNARTIIDVGMNIGTNTIEYGTWAKEVHGFEPTPQTYDLAIKNIDIAKNQTQKEFKKGWFPVGDGWADMTIASDIHTYPYGLGSKADKTEIIIQKNNSGHNFLEPTVKSKRPSKVVPEKVSVDVKTLDSFNFSDVDIIKMDVEGFEYDVLLGAKQTIDKWKPVVQAEMIPAQPKRFGHSVEEIIEFFVYRDYKVLLRDGTVMSNEWEIVKGKIDRFFVHKDHPYFKSKVIDKIFE